MLQSLTPREREIVLLVAKGMSNKEVAKALEIKPATVKAHLESVYGKLHVGTRAAAVAAVLQSQDSA